MCKLIININTLVDVSVGGWGGGEQDLVYGDLSNTWAGADTRPVFLVTFWRHRTGWLEVGRFFFDSSHLVNGYKHRFWNLPNVGRNPGSLIPWKRVISVKALLRVPLDLMMEKI